MYINIVKDDSFGSTIFFEEVLKGIREYISRKDAEIRFFDEEELAVACQSVENECFIIIGGSVFWLNRIVQWLCSAACRSIIIGSGDIMYGKAMCSTVTPDYAGETYRALSRLRSQGCERIAFLGFNPDSYADILKYRGFISHGGTEKDVFDNTGDVLECCNRFESVSGAYDGIVFANDYIAVLYLKQNKTSCVKLASFGSTSVLSHMRDDVIQIELDFKAAGRSATQIYFFLKENESMDSVSVRLRSACGAPVYEEANFELPGSMVKFYENENISEIIKLDRLLVASDRLDIDILNCLTLGMTYESTAERCITTVATVKYRIGGMLRISGIKNRVELLKLYKGYAPE